MTIQFRCLLVAVSIIMFLYLMHKIKKAQMKIEDSVYWIFLSVAFLLLSIFPSIAIYAAKWLGIESPANLVFLIIIFLLLVKLFLQAVKMSEMEYKLKSFVQEVAIKSMEKQMTAKQVGDTDMSNDCNERNQMPQESKL